MRAARFGLRLADSPWGERLLLAALVVLTCSAASLAQSKNEEKKKPPPEPEEIDLRTQDGVILNATFYGSNQGENAAPIILLHGYLGSRHDFRDFALYLQREHDFAVLVPDLRGHGDSTIQVEPGGEKREIKAEKLRANDFAMMVSIKPNGDMETLKRFLNQRNNARELNIERLGLCGTEMGALVAAEWAYADWEIDNLPTAKQGSDVKALALISPDLQIKGLHAAKLADPPLCGEIGLQIIAGADDPRALRAARQVYNLVRRCYHDPPDDAPPEVVREQKKLFFDVGYKTSLQGTKMLGEKLGLERRIARFFELRLVLPTSTWQERKNPL